MRERERERLNERERESLKERVIITEKERERRLTEREIMKEGIKFHINHLGCLDR